MLTLQEKTERYLSKLEAYYPEHQVFALDSIDSQLRNDLTALSRALGFPSLEAFLHTHGYSMITGDAVKRIRGTVKYPPGKEPEVIKTKVENMLCRLEEYYPDHIIPRGIQADHKSLSGKVSGLYQWLGYADAREMLTAYGYDVQYENAGRKQTNDYLGFVEMLREKYAGNPVSGIDDIKRDFPESAGLIKSLSNNSKESFGMPLNAYLESIGVLQRKRFSVKYHYARVKIEGTEQSVLCFGMQARRLAVNDLIEMQDPETGDSVNGRIEETFFFTPEPDLPCPVAEMYQFVRKYELITYLTVSVFKEKEPVFCLPNGLAVHENNYIVMEAPADGTVSVGQVKRIDFCYFEAELPCPLSDMRKTIRRLPQDEEPKYLFCSVQIKGRSDCLYYISPFEEIEVGDTVSVPHSWYGYTTGIVRKVELVSKKTAPYYVGKTLPIQKIISSRKAEREKAASSLEALIAINGTEQFEPKPVVPEASAATDTLTYFSSAVFRGLDQDIINAIDSLGNDGTAIKKISLGNGISQVSCPSVHVPQIVKDFPKLKGLFFSENWNTGEVYLAYSESGYSTVTGLRLIGKCDFYQRDRWPLIHDPAEDEFTEGSIRYVFAEKAQWETLDYVLPDGKTKLCGNQKIQSKPHRKKRISDPCKIIQIHFPENERFYTPAQAAPRSDYAGVPEKISGKTFVVTGELVNFPDRDTLKQIIEAAGGKLTGSVSSKTTALVTNDPNSGTTKNRAAKQMGIPVLSERAFIEQYLKKNDDGKH